MGALIMSDVHGLVDRHASDSRSGWPEDGRAFGLDDQGNTREMSGLATRKSNDPVLRIGRLSKEKVPTLGRYHQAVIVPNKGS